MSRTIPKKILIVDDNPAILDALQILLEDAGYDIMISCDGREICQGSSLPDILLLDVWLSGYDGREICRELKRNKRTRHIPIVMISAARDVKESVLAAGADEFLQKPFDIDDLLSVIEDRLPSVHTQEVQTTSRYRSN